MEYLVKGPVEIADLIGTLQAQQVLAKEFGELLEITFDGLKVQRVELKVHSLTTGSVREYFWLAVFVAYQKELQASIPPMLEHLLGVEIDDSYNALVTVSMLLLVFYGADYAYKRLVDRRGSDKLAAQVDSLVEELAAFSHKPAADVRRLIDAHLGKKGKAKDIAKAAIKFFKPSRMQNNDTINVGQRVISPDVIAEVPFYNGDALDKNEHGVPVYNTRIELNAKDRVRDGQGWYGIVKTISDDRKPTSLFPEVSRDFLWQHDFVWADVMVIYRVSPTGIQEPVRYQIMRVHKEAD